MEAFIDRILVEEIKEESDGKWVDETQVPPLKKVRIISAGMSSNGMDNSNLNGAIAYLSGKAVGIPQTVDGKSLYIYRLHNIETYEQI